jgi:hypothetical protein
MSTRTQIEIAGTDLKVYQHCDGYPSNMLKILLPFVESFMKYRGHDAEYMVAQLVHTLISASEKSQAEFYADCPNLAPKDPHPSYTGFGVDRELHGDIEYLYYIGAEGSVTVKATRHSSDYSQRKFVVVGKFKLGTTYETAMGRLRKRDPELAA